MASTYTTNSGIEKPGTGEQSGLWGDTVNLNMDIIDRLTNGVGAISLSGTTHTLTVTDGALSDGQFKVLVLGGSPSGTNTITVAPNDADRWYIVKNGSGESAIFTQGSGGNVTVLNGDTKIIYCDGAGAGAAVVDVTNDFAMGSVNIDGGTIDGVTLGTNSAVTEAQIDNININGNAIISTNTNGNIALTPNGTGEVDISKVDIDGGSIDGTTIGAASAAAGTFTTVTASGDVTIADKIVHDGDTNTAIRFPAADTVAVETAGVERMRIDSSGNVGIGTSSPSAKLEVSSTGSAGRILLNAADTPMITNGYDKFTSGAYQGAGSWGLFMEPSSLTFGAYNSGVFAFKHFNADSTSSERMRIDSSGRVGIGAATPACLFHAYGGNSGASFATAGLGRFESNGDVLVHWGTPTANQAIIRHATALDQQSAAIVMDGTNRYMSFHTVNGTERMRINNGGNISIGTTTVNARLTVDGAVTLTNQDYAYYAQSGGAAITGYVTGQNANYSIWASDRISAVEFNARSDRRLKKGVAEIPAQDAVAFVQTVPAVRYKWKGSEDDGDKFGFLAQDVVKAGFPHLVGQYPSQNLEEDSDKDGFVSPAGVMLTINYDQIIPVLSAALKEAFAEIANLKARVAEIESSKGDAA